MQFPRSFSNRTRPVFAFGQDAVKVEDELTLAKLLVMTTFLTEGAYFFTA